MTGPLLRCVINSRCDLRYHAAALLFISEGQVASALTVSLFSVSLFELFPSALPGLRFAATSRVVDCCQWTFLMSATVTTKLLRNTLVTFSSTNLFCLSPVCVQCGSLWSQKAHWWRLVVNCNRLCCEQVLIHKTIMFTVCLYIL